jgi:hypothetical protein
VEHLKGTRLVLCWHVFGGSRTLQGCHTQPEVGIQQPPEAPVCRAHLSKLEPLHGHKALTYGTETGTQQRHARVE